MRDVGKADKAMEKRGGYLSTLFTWILPNCNKGETKL